MTSVLETLDWLIEYWPDLLEARLPMATPRPWQQATLSPEVKDRRDEQAHIERAERSVFALGESPAPVDVSILQTTLDVLVQADDLAAELTEWSIEPSPHPPELGELDARPWFHFIRARLVVEHEDLGEPGPWHEHAEPRVFRMYEQAARALSMLYHGQTVKVVCPWCSGRTPENPVGGAYTWEVTVLPNNQVAIICHGTHCNPPAEHVGTWLWGQPCWPILSWEKLAKHVLPEHERAQRARDAIAS